MHITTTVHSVAVSPGKKNPRAASPLGENFKGEARGLFRGENTVKRVNLPERQTVLHRLYTARRGHATDYLEKELRTVPAEASVAMSVPSPDLTVAD